MAVMYTSIRFATLQLHFNQEGDSQTLSKTIPIYEKDFFILSEEEFLSGRVDTLEIKAAIYKKAPKEFVFYPELLNVFQWHLN